MTVVQPTRPEQKQAVAEEDGVARFVRRTKKVTGPVAVASTLIAWVMFFGAAVASPSTALVFAFGFILSAPVAFVSVVAYLASYIYLRRTR